MNKSIIIGRISSDLNLKYTPNGNAVCEFNVAVNRPIRKDKEKETDFIPCVVWNKQAENLVNFQNKGSLIAIEGSYRVDKYKNDKEEIRYKHYILVNGIQFLESKKEQSNNNQITKPIETKEKEENDPFRNFGNQITPEDIENDLPF